MEDFETGFGDADFSDAPSGGSKYIKEKSVPEGVSRFRFLPPMKSLQNKRDGWKIWGAVHYGYCGTKKNRPDEAVQRPFGCIQKKDRNGNVYATCEACKKHAIYKDQAERHQVKLKEQGLSKDQIRDEAAMKQLNDWLWNHNCDKKFRVAALEEGASDSFVILKINFTLMKDIDQLFKKLANDSENPINPLSVNQGVWLEFTRTGKDFRVDVVKERVNIPGVGVAEKIKLAPLSAEQQQLALAKIQDLTTCISVLSAEQIRMIVEGPQDPESIDAVWALGQSSMEVSPDGVPVAKTVTYTAPTRPYVAPPAVSVPMAPVTAVTTEVDEEAEMLLKLEELRRKKASAVVAPVGSVAPMTTTTTITGGVGPSGDLSDAEFLNLIGGK